MAEEKELGRGPCELRYGADCLILEEIHYNPGDAANGNPYNTTCRVKVVSGGFAGAGEWEFDWQEFLRFVIAVEELYGFQCQKVEFRDIGYGSWAELEMDRAGHMEVSGKLYSDDGRERQALEFRFAADQTALKPFLEQLKQSCW